MRIKSEDRRRSVVVERLSASVQMRLNGLGHQTLGQRSRRHPHLQTELVTSSCMPVHFRVPVPGRTA